ncbi:MAG: type II toxin-antitoxin system RelE/ParE family toxin [bacterium]
MLQIELHHEVYDELENARVWYEEQAKGLGTEFLGEVEHAVNLISQYPNTWSPYYEGTRRFLLHRFPFAIVYRYERDRIRVFALMHLRQRPGYWRHREF